MGVKMKNCSFIFFAMNKNIFAPFSTRVVITAISRQYNNNNKNNNDDDNRFLS